VDRDDKELEKGLKQDLKKSLELLRKSRERILENEDKIEKLSKKLIAGRSLEREYERLSEELKLLRERVVEITSESRSVRCDFPKPKIAKRVRMAVIMDEFTYRCFENEAVIERLTPDRWREELEEFDPDILFVESAWLGEHGEWKGKIASVSSELREITAWCEGRGVVTLFWNKEDPVHFNTFINSATLFDFVFTTDIGSIPEYKRILGHDNVFLMPFAAQPTIHNPIWNMDREDAFCFAGAYYRRYTGRMRDFENFVSGLSDMKKFVIYDRNYGKNDPDYSFPETFAPFIVGSLPVEDIDRAYRGYRYTVNMNSVKDSQSMFARRVFEAVASNAMILSNYSRGVRLLFGDLVVSTDSADRVRKIVETMDREPLSARRVLKQAYRKVMMEHTYAERFGYLLSKVYGEAIEREWAGITVVSGIRDEREAMRVIDSFRRQRYPRKSLVLLKPDRITLEIEDSSDIHIVDERSFGHLRLYRVVDGEWVSLFHPGDHYGENYLLDLALAIGYADVDAVGKSANFKIVSGRPEYMDGIGKEYAFIDTIAYRRALCRLDRIGHERLSSWIERAMEGEISDGKALAVDAFEYCENAHTLEDESLLSEVSDAIDIDHGISMDALLTFAESMERAESAGFEGTVWDGKRLGEIFHTRPGSAVTLEVRDGVLAVESNLEEGKHDYIYSAESFPVGRLARDGKIDIYLETTPGIDTSIALLFIDEDGHRVSHAIGGANRNLSFEVPDGTVTIRPALRFFSGGISTIETLVLGKRNLPSPDILLRGDYLLVTDNYPEYGNIYRNMFVHTRVVEYMRSGISIDVFRAGAQESLTFHEYEGVDVLTAPPRILANMLRSGRYRKVLIHFMNPEIWSVLEEFAKDLEMIVWVHGADIEPWYRRNYDFTDAMSLERAKMESRKRMEFWRGLFMEKSVRFVFVSEYSAESAMEDIGMRLPEERYSVIPNPIDTSLFSYIRKDGSMRKRVLSIRPYSSRIYANDLSVKVVEILSEKSWFEEMEFLFVGDGKLFDETLAPLKRFSNVKIERGFIPRDEIAKLHREYGIFLVPTRSDTHGVSRDEAMSSGLVPVTNDVSAVSEFVDEGCGFLAPAEDAQSLADAIERLYMDEELFLHMSANASGCVEKNRSRDIVISSELERILGK